MPGPTLKIHNARFILTLDPERRIIQNGSIVIDGQRIVQVGKASELEGIAAERVIDATEMVVTPGFCNGHMHISYAHAVRGVFPDDLGSDYLPNVFKLQSAMTPEEEYYTSLLGITELLKYGTTCFLDPGSTKYLDACMRAYEESGCRHRSGKPGSRPAQPAEYSSTYDSGSGRPDTRDRPGLRSPAGRPSPCLGHALFCGLLHGRAAGGGEDNSR